MLKVTITEKGGGDKVFFFEEGEEVTIGRLQTNRIPLSKPNVSKRHAVLSVRDNRIFVEDLGSTNGTYVNGRRITGAREIRSDDRIYIGDFTIRVRSVQSPDDKSETTLVPEPPLSFEEQRRATMAMTMPTAALTAHGREPAGAAKTQDAEPLLEAPPIPPPEELSGADPIPLELEVEVLPPESGGMDADAAVERELSEPAMVPAEPSGDEIAGAVLPASIEPSFRARSMAESAARRIPETDPYMTVLKTVQERAALEVFDSVPADQMQFSDEEWQALSDRVLALVDRMRRENALPASIDAFQVTQDLLFDFAGLGPFEELLQDRAVRRILVDGPDCVSVTRGGQTTRVRRTFSGDAALSRVLVKLLRLGGISSEPTESLIEARLPDGIQMMVLRPPLVADHVVIALDRPGGSLLDATDLVQAGVMSAEVFRVIERAVRERHNLVVSGAPNTGKLTFLNAVAHLLPLGARVVVVERNREVVLSQPEAIRLSKHHLACQDLGSNPCFITRLCPDAVILSDLDAEDARLVTALGLTGQKGVLASVTATTAELCLHRLEMLVAFGSPTVDPSIVRSLVRRFIDLIVVLGLDSEGRPRVTEVLALENGEPRRIV